MKTDKPLSYITYLKLDELLALQQPLSAGPEHDETLFIVIHQVYELWFKQLRHELNYLCRQFEQGDVPRVLATLQRVLTIFKTLVAQVDVLETMTPLSFNAFRARLEASSGFQSWQFRALEFRLGYKRAGLLAAYAPGTPAHAELQKVLQAPSVYDTFLHFLDARGLDIGDAARGHDPARPREADAQVQQALLGVYRTHPYEAQICERLVDLDEGMQEWRYRHVKMVERTIGTRSGTGGSSGVEYLRGTLFQPLFPDLWAIRSQL